MNTIPILILFPLVAAIVMLLVRNDMARNVVVRFSAVITIILTLVAVGQYFVSGAMLSFQHEEIITYCMAAVEVLVAIYIIVTGIRHKKLLVSLLAIIQTPLMLWFEFSGRAPEVHTAMVIDKLTIVMLLIVGVVGGLICLYSAGYMKWYHVHHSEYKERKSFFFAFLFIFLSAMFGLILSNSLTWMYFCWEITTLCSFLLIGYTKTAEATNNAFRALVLNLTGGLAFAGGIVLLGTTYHTIELSALLRLRPELMVMTIVFLFVFAALTKSAQIPFSSWLLGAMVAPTPTSALLHSATMVKAGVYFAIRLAPLMMGTSVGTVIALVGAITFLVASILAITQSDAKKILAYSTISNLGLIITCAGIGTKEAIWVAIMLMIFHAICKSLLFLTVGAAEHQLGNRNVESMDALASISKRLSFYMMIGIAGMFLAPFGMLISKWAAIKAFIDSDNIFAVIIVAFGSATTVFYWAKWLGKLVAGVNAKDHKPHKLHADEDFSMIIHVIFVIVACFTFPLISKYIITPFLGAVDMQSVTDQIYIIIFMLIVILIVPLTYILASKNDKSRIAPIYMAGINAGDNENFIAATMVTRKAEMRNWYMEDVFKPVALTRWSNIISLIILGIGVLLLMGGVA